MKNLDPKAVWLFFIQYSFAFCIILIFVPLGLLLAIPTITGLDLTALLAVLLCFVGLAFGFGFAYFWAVLTYNNYKYELTKDGFKKEKGVIFKKYTTIPYERIQNVDIYRGILARMLGLSDLQVQTAGMSFTGQYGASAEGRLPGLSTQEAESLREELIKRAKGKQGV